MEKQKIIQVKDLVTGYEGDLIFDKISFDVCEGEVFIVLGGSGCGKSTLLKHLIGLMKPLSGQIIIDGDDIFGCDEAGFRNVLRKTGVLYQGAALFGSMTLAENVALPIKEYTDLPQKSIDTLVRMKLKLVNLEGYEDHLPSQISGGMKKKAGLARAMALNPKILFFDEPSAGLDPVSSVEMDNLIMNLNKSLATTMVIVTHELQSVFTVAHRIIILDKASKGIIAEGDPRHLRDHSRNSFVRQFLNRQTEDKHVSPDSALSDCSQGLLGLR